MTRIYQILARRRSDGQRLDLLVEASSSESAVNLWCGHYGYASAPADQVDLTILVVPPPIGYARVLIAGRQLENVPS